MKRRLLVLLMAFVTLFSSISVYASTDTTNSESAESTTSAMVETIGEVSAIQTEADKGCMIPATSDTLNLAADGAALIDGETGEFLYRKNSTGKYYPASITKIVTTLVAIEKGNLSDPVTYSADTLYAIEQGSSRIGIEADETLSLEDSLYCVMLASGNDAAAGVADHIAGSQEAFAELMNQKVKELGCENTHFTNPHGLHSEEHYTTAADMAKIMYAAMQNEDFKRIASTVNHTVAASNLNEERPLWNHHKMMLPAGDKYYEGVGAGKTGFTSIALNTLVTTAERDGRSLIAVVLHCPGAQYTYSDTKTLFDYGFENFTTLKPLEEFNLKAIAEESGVPEEAMKKLEEVNVLFNGNYAITASKKVELSDIKISVTTENAADGLWGSICFTYQNEEIGRANIYYDADEEYLSILEQDTIITETAAKVPFILVGVTAFLVIMILYLSISMFIRRKR